jgi:uncharacterized YigZ family protein
MDERYITISGEGVGSLVEKKSEFIGYASHVTTELEALSFLESVRKKHSEAKHCVYAYVLKNNHIMRYSDDGEPQGTAGIPIVERLRKTELTDVLLVVVRACGGILLGTGGLARAYGTAAGLALENAGIGEWVVYDIWEFTTPYPMWQKIQFLFKREKIEDYSVDFEELIHVRVALPTEKSNFLSEQITEISSGKIQLEFQGQKYGKKVES